MHESFMSKHYTYYPPDKPVVGGHSATFSEIARSFGKSTAIAATKRIIQREPYEPTGDEAFDLRAQAFKAALLAGTSKAYEESNEAFTAVGLYWQGTYGDPKKTERFKSPPTNSLEMYSPGPLDLFRSVELQEWMFKDFNYAAWLWVKEVAPYIARATYVKLADQLLREIPGPHLKVMDTWPKWDKRKSPPVPGGHYPNPKWRPLKGLISAEASKPLPQTQSVTSKPPGPHDQPVVGDIKVNPLMVPKFQGQETSEAGQRTSEAVPKDDSTDSETTPGGVLEPEIAKIKAGHSVPLGTIETSRLANDAGFFDPPTVGLAHDSVVEQPEDVESTASDESIDLNDALSRIKGIRPEAPAIGQGPGGSLGTPGGTVKYIAAMGGIGVGIGTVIGLAVVGLKHFGIWPFNRRKGRSQANQKKRLDNPQEKTSGQAYRRNHPRSWAPADNF